MAKLVSAREAIDQIQSGSTLFVGSFGGMSYPEALAKALGERFDETGTPRNLDFWASVTGSRGLGLQSERFVRDGIFRRVYLSHYATCPPLTKLALEEKIEAYNISMGTWVNLFRAAASRKPALITETGVGTQLDPRYGGGKFNKSAKEDICQVIELDGQEYLLFKTPKVDVVFLRGTTADPEFNITVENECCPLDMLSLAMAAKASGGLVICQVARLSARKALPKDIEVPGFLIDYVVEEPGQTMNRVEAFNPAYTGDFEMPAEKISAHLDWLREATNAKGNVSVRALEDYIIARRATSELFEGAVVNLGYGIPDMVGGYAYENGMTDKVLLTLECGVLGGVPCPGAAFGSSINPKIIYRQSDQFNLYNGRGLDLCFVGAMEVDAHGNTNVSELGRMRIGVGGFIDITQRARKNVFLTPFMGGKMKIAYEDGKLHILEEGKHVKFKKDVQAISFSGDFARRTGQEVLYVTERCVFRLTPEGLELAEIAPGIDLERDILAHMDFKPIIPEQIPLMGAEYFELAKRDEARSQEEKA